MIYYERESFLESQIGQLYQNCGWELIAHVLSAVI